MNNSKPSILGIFHQLAQPELLPLRWRIWIVGGSFVLYGILLYIFLPILGGVASSLTAIPIVAAAWFFGFRVANIAFITILALNILFISQSGIFSFERFLRNNGSYPDS